MLSLVQARRLNREAGEPLFSPHPTLTKADAHLRRGDLALIAGPPGVAKSGFIQHWLQRGDGLGNVNRTLYFSADSGPATLHIRAAAIATGWTLHDIEGVIREGDAQRIDEIVAQATGHMSFNYESTPDEDFVCTEIEAYATLWGAYPDAIVMDNLRNLTVSEENEFRALEDATFFLSGLAKDTNAAVIALHHVGGEYDDAARPIPLSGIRGKASKTSQLILTLFRPADGFLGVSVTKNRHGPADATGKNYHTLPLDLERMAVGQIQSPPL